MCFHSRLCLPEFTGVLRVCFLPHGPWGLAGLFFYPTRVAYGASTRRAQVPGDVSVLGVGVKYWYKQG